MLFMKSRDVKERYGSAFGSSRRAPKIPVGSGGCGF